MIVHVKSELPTKDENCKDDPTINESDIWKELGVKFSDVENYWFVIFLFLCYIGNLKTVR